MIATIKIYPNKKYFSRPLYILIFKFKIQYIKHYLFLYKNILKKYTPNATTEMISVTFNNKSNNLSHIIFLLLKLKRLFRQPTAANLLALADCVRYPCHKSSCCDIPHIFLLIYYNTLNLLWN